MGRECRPPAREPARSWLAPRSTMATSIPANANSPANISPVGPPPAITTACSVMVRDSTARPGSCRKPPGALYAGSGEALVLVAQRRLVDRDLDALAEAEWRRAGESDLD